MKRSPIVRTANLLLAVSALTAGCAPKPSGSTATASTAMGWRFGPGLSCRDEALFAAPPVVLHRGGTYALAWTYGSQPFFFRPEYKPLDGRLVVALQATSSSGNVANQRTELRIEGADSVAALEHGGAYFWEPDGTYVKLDVADR